MGQSQSNNKDERKQVQGGIRIQIPKTFYLSDEQIDGIIHINLEEQFQGHILMIGLEGSQVDTCFGNEDNQFLNYTQPLYDFAQNCGSTSFLLYPGQWSIPFSLKIGNKLPQSLNYFQNSSNKCSVSYKLISFIVPNNPNYKPLQGNQEIMIGQQINILNPQLNKVFTQYFTSSCCCCDLGSATIKGIINKQYFSPNEEIQLQLECEFLKCKSNVTSLIIKFYGILVMASAEFGKNTKYINVVNKDVLVDSKQMKCFVKLQIPNNSQLSTQTTKINLKYFVEINPILDSCCLEAQQNLQFELQINPARQRNNSLPSLKQVQTPLNWNPIQVRSQIIQEQQALQMQKINAQYNHCNEQKSFLDQKNNYMKQCQPFMSRQE